MSLVKKVIAYTAAGVTIATISTFAAWNINRPSLEEMYEQGRLDEQQEQRNLYIDDLRVEIIPGIQQGMEDLDTKIDTTKEEIFTKIDTTKQEIYTKMDEKIDPIKTGMDELSADFTAYLEKQESQVNAPSGRGRGNVCYDMPYSSGVIGISFTNSETQKFERWAGYRNFRNAFPNVPRWFDGDYRNGEGHKLHVSALGEHRVYSNDGNPIYRNSSNSWGLAESYHADTGRGTLQYESNFKPRCR